MSIRSILKSVFDGVLKFFEKAPDHRMGKNITYSVLLPPTIHIVVNDLKSRKVAVKENFNI
jgi:hypothetical protein